jgi:hypothetical protein
MNADKEEGTGSGASSETLKTSPPPSTEGEHPKKYTSVHSVGISHDRNARFRRSMEVYTLTSPYYILTSVLCDARKCLWYCCVNLFNIIILFIFVI